MSLVVRSDHQRLDWLYEPASKMVNPRRRSDLDVLNFPISAEIADQLLQSLRVVDHPLLAAVTEAAAIVKSYGYKEPRKVVMNSDFPVLEPFPKKGRQLELRR
ncbi:hypothetical protein NP444_03680 [Pseudomonas aeruginosa]|uniref:hypothetical protein n=1 Tax=Pseudomonas aeruginosa TaxID=287 RepID=UPI00211625A9|nr:hypothetical protein [Pseudomonas aeruginosa]UUH88028.1 hypothetical protein NP444_03680 [Pseudomonas aeruginosa]HCR1326657.1 hypothetical protein [Pseudomonas aeruginosa]